MVKTILITGATSGIGKHLAILYANRGYNLYLTGRNKGRLAEIKEICLEKGVKVEAKLQDVKNYQQMEDFINSIDNLDMVIANAGISSGTSSGLEEFSKIKEVFDINLYGVLNTITPAINKFKEIGKGQVVIVSSLASYRGMSGSPAYCSSKAAVRVYGEALRDLLRDDNIKVNIVCPGFIRSGITDQNNFKMPFFMETEKAVKIIAKGIDKNKAVIAFPFPMAFMAWFMMCLPTCVSSLITRFLPKK
jgi:short-subunit dehydrogenase